MTQNAQSQSRLLPITGNSESAPQLHLLCGKICAGKSTLARQLSQQNGALSISEDRWLALLWPEEILTVPDYIRCSQRLHTLLAEHLQQVLSLGLPVVLDVPLNTPARRAWAKDLAERAGVVARLHYLDIGDEQCKQRLVRRNADGLHAFTTSEAEFDLISSYFVPPTAQEGLEVVRYPEPAHPGAPESDTI